jgi:hypothetical protein
MKKVKEDFYLSFSGQIKSWVQGAVTPRLSSLSSRGYTSLPP